MFCPQIEERGCPCAYAGRVAAIMLAKTHGQQLRLPVLGKVMVFIVWNASWQRLVGDA